MTYQVMIEIKQSGGKSDDAPSLIYAVEVDNADPTVFQLFDMVGYPKKVEKSEEKEEWAIYCFDQPMSPALELIDSALLTIERIK